MYKYIPYTVYSYSLTGVAIYAFRSNRSLASYIYREILFYNLVLLTCASFLYIYIYINGSMVTVFVLVNWKQKKIKLKQPCYLFLHFSFIMNDKLVHYCMTSWYLYKIHWKLKYKTYLETCILSYLYISRSCLSTTSNYFIT